MYQCSFPKNSTHHSSKSLGLIHSDLLDVRIIDSGLKFILFLFLFLFQFIFYLKKLGLGFSIILHVTVTKCHMTRSESHISHMIQWKVVEGSGRNSVIQYI